MAKTLMATVPKSAIAIAKVAILMAMLLQGLMFRLKSTGLDLHPQLLDH